MMARQYLSGALLTLLLLTSVRMGATDQSPAPVPGGASRPASASDVDLLLENAEKLLSERKGNLAVPIFERALQGARELTLERQEAQALAGISEVSYYNAQYASARDRGLRALEIFERLAFDRGIGRTSNLLSGVEEMMGNRQEARRHATRALAVFDSLNEPRGRASATLQLIRVSDLDLTAEVKLFEKAIDDARSIGDRNIEGVALHSLGDRLFSDGFYAEALEPLTQAAASFEQTNNPVALGTVYNSLGRVYRAHGRLDQALKLQLKALDLHRKANSPFQILQSLNAVATVYERLGEQQQAKTYYEQALALAEKSSSPRIQDFIRANFVSLLLGRGEFARGAETLEQVIARGLDAFPNLRYAELSRAYTRMSRHEEAVDAATKAVTGCEQIETACVVAFRQRAAAHAALGETAAALSDINAALDNLEDTRARLVPSDFFKQDFHRAQESIYSQAIALQVGHKQERLALETAERARSRAFLDLLASRDVQLRGQDPSLLASNERPSAHVELAPASSQTLTLTLRGAAEGNAGTSPVASGFSRKDQPGDELPSAVTAAPSATEDLIATAARLKSTLLVYWVGDDELFIWVVAPDGAVQARRVSVLQSRLQELIRATSPFVESASADGRVPARGTIATRGSMTVALRNNQARVWRDLYDILVAPVESFLPRETGSLLTIIPQGALLNVSFAALQNGRGRYLLEDYTLHYAPAGAMLQFTERKRRADARTGDVLVVADPALPRLSALDRPLARLPGARSEAAAISRLVPASRFTLMRDAAATEASAIEQAKGKAVLHFATHAIVRDDDPFGSFLALGPSADAGTDGLLTSREVYGLDLNADLVVLSACRSAGGRITGDGISAFARAFIYAGTASLIASLWDVADEPTNRLLPDFYRSWLGGQSKGRALREAQLRLLRDLRAGRVRISTPAGAVSLPEHPVFWAGFALFGEAD